MCITLIYICPACRNPSGHAVADPCPPEQQCIEKLHLTRLMQARHFTDWNCGTPGCEYSREGQQTEMATTLAAIEAMREASTRARFEVSRNLAGSEEDAERTANPNTSDVEDPDEQEESGASDSGGEGDDLGSDGGQPPAQNAWRLADGLPVFNYQTGQQIDNLLARVVAEAAECNSAVEWVPAEDDLLLLLRQFQLSHASISAHFLGRHSRTACETRRSRLRKQGR